MIQEKRLSDAKDDSWLYKINVYPTIEPAQLKTYDVCNDYEQTQ